MAAPCGQPSEDTDQAKDTGGCPDRAVGGSVVDGIGQIPEPSTHDEGEDATAYAESPRERRQEESAEEGIADDVGQVGVKRECGQYAPTLAREDERGLTLPEVDDRVVLIRARQPQMKSEQAEGEGIGHRDLDRSGCGSRRQRACLLSRSLGALDSPRLDDQGGRVRLGFIHLHSEKAGFSSYLRSEAFGRQDEGPLLGFAFAPGRQVG